MTYAIVASFPLFLAGAYAVRLQDDLSMSKSQFGWAVAAYIARSAIGSPRIGGLLDRRGSQFGFVVATLGGATAALLIGLGVVALGARHRLVGRRGREHHRSDLRQSGTRGRRARAETRGEEQYGKPASLRAKTTRFICILPASLPLRRRSAGVLREVRR